MAPCCSFRAVYRFPFLLSIDLQSFAIFYRVSAHQAHLQKYMRNVRPQIPLPADPTTIEARVPEIGCLCSDTLVAVGEEP